MKSAQMTIARSILGKEKFIEIYGEENLPNLKMRVTLRHDRNRKQFERVFPIGEDVMFEGYAHNNLSYPSYLIDRFEFLKLKDNLTKSVTITDIEPC